MHRADSNVDRETHCSAKTAWRRECMYARWEGNEPVTAKGQKRKKIMIPWLAVDGGGGGVVAGKRGIKRADGRRRLFCRYLMKRKSRGRARARFRLIDVSIISGAAILSSARAPVHRPFAVVLPHRGLFFSLATNRYHCKAPSINHCRWHYWASTFAVYLRKGEAACESPKGCRG